MIGKLANSRRKMFCAAILIGLGFITGLAQQSKKPVPPPANDQADVVRINTTLVQVDALVRDEKGRVISDLRAEDFVIVENGRAHPAEYCSYINLVSERPIQNASTDGRLSKNELGRAIAFIITRPIIDATISLASPRGGVVSASGSNRNLAATDANTIRDLLLQFVEQQIGARDLVAVHSIERDLGVLANFTTDRDVMRSAIEHAMEPVPSASWVRLMITSDGIAGNLVDHNLAVVQTLRNAIEQLQSLPGRKLVVLVSRGFLIHPRLNRSEQVREQLRAVTAQANRAGVAIYTLNPRGIGLTSGVYQDMDSLIALSQETGGKAIYNTNDLSLGFGEILKENEGYYLLGYQPENDDPQAPHKIKVQVKRPKLTVQTRQTVFSGTRLFNSNEAVDAGNLNVALNTPFSMRNVGVRLLPEFHSPDGKTLRVISKLNVELPGITLESQPDGGRFIALELAMQIVGPDRKVIKKETKAINVSVSADDLKLIEQEGIPFSFGVDVPSPGPVQINVALRDTPSGRIGNASRFIQVPDVSRGALIATNLTLRSSSAKDSTGFRLANQFGSGERLRYQCRVYNARRTDSDHTVRLQATIRLRLKDKTLTQAKQNLIVQASNEGELLTGEWQLPTVPPGSYRLEMVIEDLLNKGSEHVVSTMLKIVE